MADVETELPKAQLKRIVKTKLASTATDGKEMQLAGDALMAFGESAKVSQASAQTLCHQQLTPDVLNDFKGFYQLHRGDSK